MCRYILPVLYFSFVFIGFTESKWLTNIIARTFLIPNGYTSIPRQGEIASGYFALITIRYVEMNLNKYKFAQQLPISEVLILTFQPNVEDGWKEDLIFKVDFKGWHFISKHPNKLDSNYKNYL